MGSVSLEQRVEDSRRVVGGVLTAREYEVLVLAAQGDGNEEIGGKLGFTKGTAGEYMKRIYTQLGARNRAHCVHLAHERGLLGGRKKPGQAPPEGLFKRVGLTYRPVHPQSLTPPKTTHVLHVVHPHDKSKSWELSISVPDDGEAHRRMTQLAGWVFPPYRIVLSRAGTAGTPIGTTAAFRIPHCPPDVEPVRSLKD